MAAVFVDDQPYQPQGSPQQSVQDLAREICSCGDGSGRTVIEVWCEGQKVQESDLESVLNSAVSSFSRLDLQTGSLSQLACATVEQAIATLEETISNREQLVEQLGQGQYESAMKLLKGLLESWRQSQQSAELAAQILQINLAGLQAEGRSFDEILAGLKAQLGSLRDAVQASDPVLVADIVRYELVEPLAHWVDLLKELAHAGRAGVR